MLSPFLCVHTNGTAIAETIPKAAIIHVGRPQIRPPAIWQSLWLHAHGSVDPCTRHRRQYGDLQYHPRNIAADLPAFGPDDRSPECISTRELLRGLLPRLHGVARQGYHLFPPVV